MRLRLKYLFLILIIFTGSVLTSACTKYEENGIGEGVVLRMGAGFRSEGGGISEKVGTPGTIEVAGFTVDYEAFHECYTPRTIAVTKKPIVMINMKNQELKYDLYLTYSQNPSLLSTRFGGFKNYEQEITTLFTQSALRVLSPLDMGVSLDENRVFDPEFSFEDRKIIAKRILDDFTATFTKQYPKYVDCFFFIDSGIGNVDFDQDVLKDLEKAVGKKYESETLKFIQQREDLKGQIEVAKSAADLTAYGTEAKVLDGEILQYMGLEVVDDIITNPEIDTTLIIPMNPQGGISWLDDDKKNN